MFSQGRQLRLIPSTWRSATVGGFVAGGSGGIGSVRWGFLRDPGHLIGLEVVTLEESPRKIELNAKESEPLNHAYGTNGIITALNLSQALQRSKKSSSKKSNKGSEAANAVISILNNGPKKI